MTAAIAMIAYIQSVAFAAAWNPSFGSGRWIIGGMLAYFLLLGFLMPGIQRNPWIGVRTRWSMESEPLWRSTQTLAGVALVLASIVGLLAVAMGAPLSWVLLALLVALVVPVAYSYLVSRSRQSMQVVMAMALLLASSRLHAGEEPVEFKGHKGLVLHGLLRTPAGEGKHPAVLLLPGSGPPDRDGNVPPHLLTNLLKEIAERLESVGVASLRFDKRSVATYASHWPKDPAQQSAFFAWEAFVGDAKAAIRFLREQPRIDPRQVLVLGHSEGGLIALQIGADWARTAESLPALVLLATPGRSLAAVLQEQIEASLLHGVPNESLRNEYLRATERAIRQIRETGTVPQDLPAGLETLFRPNVASLLRSYFELDPLRLARRFTGSVLILQGERDSQVSVRRDAPRLEEAFRSRTTGAVELFVVPKASHNFKEVAAIGDPGLTGNVLPAAMDKILSWTTAFFGRKPPDHRHSGVQEGLVTKRRVLPHVS
jgi:acetyl esterase/lipase